MPKPRSPAVPRARGTTSAAARPGLTAGGRARAADAATLDVFAAVPATTADNGQLDVLAAVRALGRDGAMPEAAEASRQEERARVLTAAAVSAYWAAVTHTSEGPPPRIAPGAPGGDATLPAALAGRAAALGAALAAGPRPVAAYALGTLYTVSLPAATRAALGAFFTPPPVVERLFDLVEEAGADWTRGGVVDPAAGGGAFVVPAAERIAARMRAAGAGPREILASVNRRVRGLELDPFSAWLTRVLLDVALWEHSVAAGAPGRPLRLAPLVRVCDALDAPGAWDGEAALVLGNPPYGKVALTPAIRARYGRSLYGHANLYGLFFDLAIRLTAPGGVVGFVTPASFLGGQYFTRLRALMAAEAPPLAVDFIADRSGVFEDVLQETVLVTLRRAGGRAPAPGTRAVPNTDGVRVRFTRVAGVRAACETDDAGAFPLPADPRAPWLLPRAPGDAALLRRLAAMPHRLADYGYQVSTGPLVWNRHKAQLTGDARAPGALPLVWAEAVLPGGRFRFAATRRNHVPYVRVADGQPHLVTREACVLVQRTTAKEQDRRLVAAVLPAAFVRAHGGVVVENHVNVVRNGAPAAPGCGGAAGLEAVAALLNTGTVDRVFRCISGSVAVSAYELSAVPLPAPDAMRAFAALVAGGASAEECERVAAAAYGLAPDVS